MYLDAHRYFTEVYFAVLPLEALCFILYIHHFKEISEGCPSLPSCPETTPVMMPCCFSNLVLDVSGILHTSESKPPTWLASMIKFPVCVCILAKLWWHHTIATLTYIMKPPHFEKSIHDKIFVILFETSHRTHVLVYLISKLIFFSTSRWQSLALNRSSCPWSRRESRRIPRKIVTMGDDVIIPHGLCDLPGEVSHTIVYDCIMSMDASHC